LSEISSDLKRIFDVSSSPLHHGNSHGLAQARQCRWLLRASHHGRVVRGYWRAAIWL
jgi:hypothetical protein